MAVAKKKTLAKTKKAVIAKAKITTKAKDSAFVRSMNPVAKEINVRLEKASKAESNAQDHRLAASIKLAEAKDRCAVQGMKFKDWVDGNVVLGYNTVRKLVTIGQQKDPAAALEDLRGKNKAHNKDLRTRKKAAGEVKQIEDKKTPFMRAGEAMTALEDKPKANLISSEAGKMGMKVVAKDVEVFDAKKHISKGGAKGTNGDVQIIKDLFGNLPRTAQLKIAEYVGKVISEKVEPKSDASLDTPPKFLNRGGKKRVKRGVTA